MEAIGPLLVLVSIPLVLRWVPRNRFYGLRVPATCGDDTIWYEVNAVHGRHLLSLGVLMVALDFVLTASTRIPVLGTIGTVGLVAIVVSDWRTANRLRREREARR